MIWELNSEGPNSAFDKSSWAKQKEETIILGATDLNIRLLDIYGMLVVWYTKHNNV